MSLKDRKIGRLNKRADRLNKRAGKHTDAVSAINQIGNVTAKGVEDNINVVKENELTPAEVAEKARQTGEGRVKSFRENIAEALPDSAIRRRMLSKAEKKRERLDAKFGKPGYSAPNDAINAKDQETFSNLSQGQEAFSNLSQERGKDKQQQDMISNEPFSKK